VRTVTRTATTTAAIAAVLMLAACGDDGDGDNRSDDAPPPSSIEEVGGDVDRFEDYLEAKPGIEHATAEVVELDTDFYGWQASVVLTPDADSAVVRDTLTDAVAFDAAADYEPGDVHLSRDGTDHSLFWGYGGAERSPAELAEMFALAEDRLGDQAWNLDEHGQLRLTDLPDIATITELAARVAADEALAEHEIWLFTTDFDLTGNEDSHALQTTTGLDQSVAGAWGALADAVGGLEQLELDNLHLVPQVGPGSYTSDAPPEGSVRLSINLDSGAGSRAELEAGALGAELRRLVAATVPALAIFPHGSEYSVSVWVEEDGDGEEIDLVDVTSDAKDRRVNGGTVADFARVLLDRVD
jgi:hypothetical protein